MYTTTAQHNNNNNNSNSYGNTDASSSSSSSSYLTQNSSTVTSSTATLLNDNNSTNNFYNSTNSNDNNNNNSRMNQQQQKMRNSFFRANRPGDLTIINTQDLNDQFNSTTKNNLLSPQQQQQIMYKTNNNNSSNYSNYQILSPQYNNNQQQQQQQHSQLSPSYNNIQQQKSNLYQQQQQQNVYSPTLPSYKNNNNNNKSTYTPLGPPPTLPIQHSQQQQIPTTPNYSPSYSSAHLVKSNQPYFNFDFPSNQQQQQQQQQRQQYNQIPQSPNHNNFQQPHVQQQNYNNSNNNNNTNANQQQNYLQQQLRMNNNSSSYQQQNTAQSPLTININQNNNQNTIPTSPHFIINQNQIIQQKVVNYNNNPPQSPLLHKPQQQQQQNTFNFNFQHPQQQKSTQSIPNSPAPTTTTTTSAPFQFTNNNQQNLKLKQNLADNSSYTTFHAPSIDNNNNCIKNFNFNNNDTIATTTTTTTTKSSNSSLIVQQVQQNDNFNKLLAIDANNNEITIEAHSNDDENNSNSSIDNDIEAILKINENINNENMNSMTVNTPPPTHTDNNLDIVNGNNSSLVITAASVASCLDETNDDIDDIAPSSTDNNNNLGQNGDLNMDSIETDTNTYDDGHCSNGTNDLFMNNKYHQKSAEFTTNDRDDEAVDEDSSSSLGISLKMSKSKKDNQITKQNHLKSLVRGSSDLISSLQNSQLIQSCNECGKSFSNKSALAKHRLIHSNERKYSCIICDKSFKRQDHLNGHLLTHQEKKPFQCKVPNCEKSYCDSRSLKRHIESQHQDFLGLLAQGNTEALNYLPRIGKLKTLGQTIVFDEASNAQEAANNLSNKRFHEILSDVLNNQFKNNSALTENLNAFKINDNNGNNNDIINSFPQKSYFTFEEPKPEICKICGKGFKNIPALNGHMRLHGGYIKPKSSNSASQQHYNEDSSSSSSMPNLGKNMSSTGIINANDSNHSSDGLIAKNREKIRLKHDSSNDDGGGNHKHHHHHHQQTKNKLIKSEYLIHHPQQQQQQLLNNDNNDISAVFPNMFQKHLVGESSVQQQQQHTRMDVDNIETNNQILSSSKNIKFLERSKNSIKYSHDNNNNIWNGNFPNNNDFVESSSSQNKLNDHLSLLNGNNNNNNNSFLVNNKFPSYFQPKNDQHIHQHHHHHHLYQQQQQQQQAKAIENNEMYNAKHNNHFINFHNLLSNQVPFEQQQVINKKRHQPIDTGYDDAPIDFSSNSTQSLSQMRDLSFKQKQVDEQAANNDSYGPQNKKQKIYEQSNVKGKSDSGLNQQLCDFECNDINKKKSINFEDISRSTTQQTVNEDNKSKNIVLPAPSPHQSSFLKNENLDSTTKATQNTQPSPVLNKPPEFVQQNEALYTSKQNINKQKVKPLPLKIPSTISTFQYPNMTLLKSPHFYETKNQYTPPPMLSPFRKAPGLYNTCFNAKQFHTAFSVPGRPPMLISSTNSMINIQNSNVSSNTVGISNNNLIEPSTNVNNNSVLTGCSFRTEGFTPQLSTPKPSLLRSRISSVASSASSFFPDEIAEGTVEGEDKTKPFVNEGPEFQAKLPKLRSKDKIEEIKLKEDLMWTPNAIKHVSNEQFNDYIELICKTSFLDSNLHNLELSLHLLSYYKGDVNKAIKCLIDGTLELPDNNAITNYAYSETNVWTKDEIKSFEDLILKNDKNFTEISKSLQTKSFKNCIEFYYIWKKAMSNDMRKKWRSFRKKRNNNANMNNIEYSLRSNKMDEVEKENLCDDLIKKEEINKNSEEQDEILDFLIQKSESFSKDDTENGGSSDEMDLQQQQKISNSSENGNNTSNKPRFQCKECTLLFKTKQKLRSHRDSKHNNNNDISDKS